MENNLLEDIKKIYEGYIAETIRLEKTRSPSDGLMGFGKRLDFDACHDAFAEQIGKYLMEEAAKSPSSAAVFEALSYIIKVPQENKSNNLAYWMLIAVQKHIKPLIPLLNPHDALLLSSFYYETYPKRTMLPVQKDIAALLKIQSGEEDGRNKHGLIGFLGRK